jgi:UDP-GlcNAc:undecaprenyl-phosphate GlcNAc-1-phosphate transferase
MVWTLGVVSIFSFAQRSNIRLQRPGAFDRLIKHKLKTNIKNANLTVKISQKFVEYGLPFVIIVTCALPGRMPRFMSFFAAGLIGIIGLTHIIWPAHQRNALRLAIYFFMPLVIYYSETRIASWVSTEWQFVYNILFYFLILFAIMTLRTTRRRHNFRLKPLDYLILFVAIIVPNLPFAGLYDFQVGAIVAKIIVLFFVFEVMVGELKDRRHRFNWGTVAALLIVMAKTMV